MPETSATKSGLWITRILAGPILLIELPALALAPFAGPRLSLAVLASSFATVLLLLGILVSLEILRLPRLAGILGLLSAVYGVAVGFLVYYRAYTGQLFDPSIAFESISDSLATGIRSLSILRLASVAAVVLGAFELTRRALTRSARAAASRRPPAGAVVVATAGALALTLALRPVHARLVMPALGSSDRATRSRAIFPETSSFRASSGDSLVMVQLESVNSLAVTGRLEPVKRDMLAGERTMMSDGIFLPNLFATGQETIRAQETMLCGLAGNTGATFTYRPGDIPDSVTCLPEILRKSGYHTVFLSALPHPNFTNRAEFLHRAGFDESHFADFMRPGDPSDSWGFYDEVFYRRAFAWLRDRFRGRDHLFIYLEVSSAHYPFEPRHDRPDLEIFGHPASSRQRYMNAYAYQDDALRTFRDEFRPFADDRTHLVVTGDHSFPVPVHGPFLAAIAADIENCLTTFLYVPPVSRRGEFAVGRTIPDGFFGEADVEPTLVELLDGKPYPNSFAPSLRTGAPPARSRPHLYIQPYNGRFLGVLDGTEHYVYSYQDHSVTLGHLDRDLLESHTVRLPGTMSDRDFLRKYMGPDSVE